MKCFYCCADLVERMDHSEPHDAVTEYEGTPVCKIHAAQIQRESIDYHKHLQEVALDSNYPRLGRGN